MPRTLSSQERLGTKPGVPHASDGVLDELVFAKDCSGAMWKITDSRVIWVPLSKLA